MDKAQRLRASPIPNEHILELSGVWDWGGWMVSANSGLGAWTLVGGAGEKSLEARDSQRRLGTYREGHDGKGNIFLIGHGQRRPKTLL